MPKSVRHMLRKLREASRSIPDRYSSALTDRHIEGIARCLVDRTIIAIITELLEIQELHEFRLYQERCVFIQACLNQINQLVAKHETEEKSILDGCVSSEVDVVTKPKRVQRLLIAAKLRSRNDMEMVRSEFNDRVREFDKKVVLDLDEQRREQQAILESVGMPTYRVTENTEEIKLQIYVFQLCADVLTHLTDGE